MCREPLSYSLSCPLLTPCLPPRALCHSQMLVDLFLQDLERRETLELWVCAQPRVYLLMTQQE